MFSTLKVHVADTVKFHENGETKTNNIKKNQNKRKRS